MRSIRVRFRTALRLPGSPPFGLIDSRRSRTVQKKVQKNCSGLIENPCLLEHVVGAVLGNSAESLAGKLHADVTAATTIELGHPNALLLEVGVDRTVDSLGDVTADTALLLGKTGAMDATALMRHGKRDIADSGHKILYG